ncbi:MAG: hypothetical protein DME45_12825 [Verrucomicrobia bacterium]|nr:MAG: hypothetical protein DME45_12825 [Verrucomicrobiota bacterium]
MIFGAKSVAHCCFERFNARPAGIHQRPVNVEKKKALCSHRKTSADYADVRRLKKNLCKSAKSVDASSEYRGRIAPSPTGLLHIGHAMTFWHAQERAREAGGKLVLRIENLDRDRCRKEFADAIIEDLHWFGFDWDEGPDIGGPFAPYVQSERRRYYLEAWEKLRVGGFVYPCKCSRKDVMQASLAPHDENEESIYPGTCRPNSSSVEAAVPAANPFLAADTSASTTGTHWRFRVPDDERLEFTPRVH